MTKQELDALVSILGRCPLTPAEALWLQALLDRLNATAQSQAVSEKPAEPKGRKT